MTGPSGSVDILLLGSGWTGSFLIPLLIEKDVSYALTSRDGKEGSLKFNFDPDSESSDAFKLLPVAKTILVVFPIYIDGGSTRLVKHYNDTHPTANRVKWIQLGSTGIWDGGPTLDEKKKSVYIDRHSPINLSNNRARCEAELLTLNSPQNVVTVLNLCGLWGGGKGAIHMIHGVDVARAILAAHQNDSLFGQRWLLTDLRVYDWWDLASRWGEGGEEGRGKPAKGPQLEWVLQLMQENSVKSLPRSPEELRKALVSIDFWLTAKITPTMGGLLD